MNVLVIRPNPEANELVKILQSYNFNAWSLPLIEFTIGKDLKNLPKYINSIPPGNMVFFLSKRSVHFTQKILHKKHIKWPKELNYYAIGHSTAYEFNKYTKLSIKYPLKNQTSDGLINLKELKNISGKIALILTSNISRNLLIKTLYKRNVIIYLCECYKSYTKIYDGIIEGKRFREINIKTLIVTSCNILQQLFNLFTIKDREEWLLKCNLLVVSKRVAILARKLGWNNIQISNGANNNSLINVLLNNKYHYQ